MPKDHFATPLAWITAALCLLAPVALAAATPDLVAWGGGLVLYLALAPTFLLPYLYDWRGAAAAFVLGEAAILTSATLMLDRGVTPQGLLPINLALGLIAVGAGRVTTLLHRSRLEAEERALIDPGTGLPNRRHALLHLKRGFAAAVRGTDLTVVAFDLDNFKQVNDRHGHAAGDHVLDVFGRILRERTRDMNLSARLGGEEFIAILEDAGMEGAVTFAEEVRTAMAMAPFSFGHVTVSAGIASYEKGMASPDVLRAAADQALYHAKMRGRNQVAVVGTAPSVGKYHGVEVDAEHATPGRGERLLLVERDPEARGDLSTALRRSGFEVIVAPSGDHAIRIVRGLGDPPAVVLTDLVMESMTGFRMVEALRSVNPDMRPLYLADRPPQDNELRDEAGVPRRFLQKPVALDRLTETIRALLDEASSASRPDATSASSQRIHVMAGDPRAAAGLAERLRGLGYDDVIQVPGGGGVRHEAPALLVVWPDHPLEKMLVAVEPYLAQWPSEARPGVLILAPRLPKSVAARWHALFPALLLDPKAPSEKLEITVRHLLEVRALTDRYLVGQHGIAAQVAARGAELESQQHDLLLRLARVAELRDDLTGKHAERVGWLSGQLGTALGLPPETVELLVQAAPLHDVGKIATPDAILNKPDELTHTERDIMRQHTVIGAQLLSGSKHRVLMEAERIARSHHERWDGKGYPEGLAGEEIPIMARIVAVADAFDCITHARSYREALSVERAMRIIRKDAGAHFDPVVAEALTELAERGALAPEWPKPPASKARRIA